jgi:hypothetical protein
MEYQTVFDISSVVNPSHFNLALGPAVIIAALILFYFSRRYPLVFQKKGKFFRKFRINFLILFGVIFGVLWSVAMGKAYEHYRWLQRTYRDGKATEYEGVVSDFVPMPSGVVGASESFIVNGRKFKYSDYEITGCFNNTSLFGGPIKYGIHVRLWAIGNCIVRLEIPQDDIRTQSLDPLKHQAIGIS